MSPKGNAEGIADSRCGRHSASRKSWRSPRPDATRGAERLFAKDGARHARLGVRRRWGRGCVETVDEKFLRDLAEQLLKIAMDCTDGKSRDMIIVSANRCLDRIDPKRQASPPN